MCVRVVAWNMAHKVASWGALEQLSADVALLSEARVPDGGLDANVLGGRNTEGRDGYPRPWAAALVSPHALREIQDARASRQGSNGRGSVRELTVGLVAGGSSIGAGCRGGDRDLPVRADGREK